MRLSEVEHRLAVALLALGVASVSFWLLAQLAGVFVRVADVALVFIFAWALAYLLLPAVTWLQRRSALSRLGAVAAVYFGLFIALAAVLALVLPVVAAQLVAFADSLPDYGDRLSNVVRGLERELAGRGLVVDVAGLYARVPEAAAVALTVVAADALGVLGGLLTIVFEATLVLIVAFFMLVDGDRLWIEFVKLLPPELASEAELFRRGADRSFGGFLRGQLLLGLAYGILTWLILLVVRVPFAALLGVISGLLMVIPFFGAIVAMFPPLLVALPQGLQTTLVTFGALLILQNVMLNVVGPRLMAHTVGIHPLFVFLVLLLGARVAGFWGVFLALPVAGIVNVFVRYLMELAQGQRARTEAEHMLAVQQEAKESPRETKPSASRVADAR